MGAAARHPLLGRAPHLHFRCLSAAVFGHVTLASPSGETCRRRCMGAAHVYTCTRRGVQGVGSVGMRGMGGWGCTRTGPLHSRPPSALPLALQGKKRPLLSGTRGLLSCLCLTASQCRPTLLSCVLPVSVALGNRPPVWPLCAGALWPWGLRGPLNPALLALDTACVYLKAGGGLCGVCAGLRGCKGINGQGEGDEYSTDPGKVPPLSRKQMECRAPLPGGSQVLSN